MSSTVPETSNAATPAPLSDSNTPTVPTEMRPTESAATATSTSARLALMPASYGVCCSHNVALHRLSSRNHGRREQAERADHADAELGSVDEARGRRVLWIALAVSTALALFSICWLIWIAADPQYWFPGAYAPQGEKGPVGDPGPRGRRGRPGPEGPAGAGVDDVASRVEEVAATAEDAASSADEAQGLASDAQSAAENAQSAADDAQSTADDALSTAEDACSELLFNTDSIGC